MKNIYIDFKDTFFGLWKDAPTIGGSVARGAILQFMNRFLLKGIQFIRTIVLARLLFPADFGLFALASVSIGFLETFIQPGFNAALVQKQGSVDRYLDSVWTVAILKSVGVGLLLFFAAPYIGTFFKNEAIIPIIRVLSFLVVIASFENVGVVLYQRDLRFNKKFLYDLSFVITEVIVVIIAALFLKNVWALVIGTFANKLAAVFFSFVLSDYRPKFRLDMEAIGDLFGFGKWVWFIGIISYFISQGDTVAIGKFLNTHELGLYTIAFALAMLPAVEIARSLGNILFPLYAKLQNDVVLLRDAFIRTSRLVFAVIIPACFGIAALAPEIVTQIYGVRWLPMVAALKILLLYGLFKSFSYTVSPFFLGIGKPQITTAVTLIQAVVLGLLIVPLTTAYGIMGTAAALVFSALFSELYHIFALRRHARISFVELFTMISLALTSGFAMFEILFFGKEFIPITNMAMLFGAVGLGVILYACFLYFLDMFFGKKILESVTWIWKNL